MVIHERIVRLMATGVVAAGAFLPLMTASASAQECPTASPSDITCNPAPQGLAQVAGATAAAPVQVKAVKASTGGLPVTGGDVVGLTVAGFGALAAGGALVRVGRSRKTVRS